MMSEPGPADSIPCTPIGYVYGGYPEKFGTPRQPGLVPDSVAEIRLLPPYDHPDCRRGLEGVSHLWILFAFHRNADRGWSSTVRPPRLGGNRRIGVFASRSPFRPNPIGMSVVEFRGFGGIRQNRIAIGNHDLIDGTPVLDIRPYVPYSDAVAGATPPAGFEQPPGRRPVWWGASAHAAGLSEGTRRFIEQTLSLDSRPAYRRDEDARVYGTSLAGYNVRWRVVDGAIVIDEITLLA